MAGSVNKVILVGNLGQDPEVVSMNDGNRIVKFSLATSERWKDRQTGEQRERTEWHRVVIFNENLGRIAEQYLQKGASVYLEGQVQTRKWQDQSGQDRYITEIVLGRFRGELTMLGSRGLGSRGGDTMEGGGGYSPAVANQGASQTPASQTSPPPPPPMSNPAADDDIPF